MQKIIYYSISNCGDGSAAAKFFEDDECAEIHQELVQFSEGWGEDCTGQLTIETTVDCGITVSKVQTREDYIKKLKSDLEYEIKYKSDKEKINFLKKSIKLLEKK